MRQPLSLKVRVCQLLGPSATNPSLIHKCLTVSLFNLLNTFSSQNTFFNITKTLPLVTPGLWQSSRAGPKSERSV